MSVLPRTLAVPCLAATASALLLAGCSQTEPVGIWQAHLTEDPLALYIQLRSCHQEVSASVEETAQEVVVVATAVRDRGEPQMDCAGDPVTVHLEQPLGDRVLVDASTGERVEVLPPEEPEPRAGR